ncbi:hypothetical protein M885DRAFT_564219 [Pelagophyceae sp. CCMP2097]|nr:hypothetical protein M885DRAFT_564219 [Pelagophyceae sp. CCMP2097]
MRCLALLALLASAEASCKRAYCWAGGRAEAEPCPRHYPFATVVPGECCSVSPTMKPTSKPSLRPSPEPSREPTTAAPSVSPRPTSAPTPAPPLLVAVAALMFAGAAAAVVVAALVASGRRVLFPAQRRRGEGAGLLAQQHAALRSEVSGLCRRIAELEETLRRVASWSRRDAAAAYVELPRGANLFPVAHATPVVDGHRAAAVGQLLQSHARQARGLHLSYS